MVARKPDVPAGVSLVEWAYQQLKSRILNNEYPPRFQALEGELADNLGISRTPVREALKRLESEGVVEVIPRRGMRVVPLSADDMREIYEVLAALETTAAELLARRRPGTTELAPMYRAVEDMDAALAADDLRAWAEADSVYHRTLLELCGNRRIAALAERMRDQIHRARLITLTLRPRPWKSNDEHREVLDAVSRGDAAAARQAHERHRARAGRLVAELLDEYPLRVL